MSRKLATIIKDSKIPGKWKRVAEAYAAFANNDGTNIYPAAKKLGAKAGCSPDTVYRNTPDLLASTILVHAVSHTCRVEACGKGKYHYTGRQGKYTTAYELRIENLQNAERYLSAKCLKVNAAKCRKVLAANCGTDSGIKETPAPAAPTLGIQDSSALTSGSEKASKVSPSLAALATAPSAPRPASAEQKNPTPHGLEIASEEKKNQPQEDPHPISEIEEEFWTQEIFTERGELMFAINPKPSVAAIEKGLPICDRILAHFDDVPEDYRGLAVTMVLKYNRAHRGHQYATKEDRKLYIRTAEQFLKALESDNATLMNDCLTHDCDDCELCLKAGALNYRKLIADMINEKRRSDEKRRAAEAARLEAERLSKLCPRCKEREPGEMAMPGFSELNGYGMQEVAKRVCDQCYDEQFEFQQRTQARVKHVLTPRPGYLEAKRKADAEKAAAKEAEAAKPKGDRSPTMCAACHKRPAVGWSYCAECDPANKVSAAAAAASKSRLEQMLDGEEA